MFISHLHYPVTYSCDTVLPSSSHLKSCCAVIVLYQSLTQEATYLPPSLFASYLAPICQLATICQLSYLLWLLEAGRKLWRSAHLMDCDPCLMIAMGLQRLLLLSDSVTWHHALWLHLFSHGNSGPKCSCNLRSTFILFCNVACFHRIHP